MAITHTEYNNLMAHLGNGIINLDTDTIKAILVNGYTFDATHDTLAEVQASEITEANGYISGGQALSVSTYAFSVDKTEWTINDPSWTAAGGDIGPTTGLILYAGTKLIAYVDFDGAQTATDTDELLVSFTDSKGFTVV